MSWGRFAVRVSPIVRVIGDNRGSSAIEYALILALVVIVAMAGLDWCGNNLQRPFSQIATRLDDPHASPQQQQDTANTPAAAADERTFGLSNLNSIRLPLTTVAAFTIAVGLVLSRRLRQSQLRLLSMSDEHISPCPLQSERVAQKRQQILRQLAHDIRLVVNNRVQVRQIMTSDPTVVLPTTPVDALTPQMIERRTRHLLVCDKEGQLLGVISDRDVLARRGRRAADIMTRIVASVAPESPLGPAVTLMLNRQISSLPVVKDGRLYGIITTSDILMTLQCTLQLLARGDDQVEPRSGTTISKLCEQA